MRQAFISASSRPPTPLFGLRFDAGLNGFTLLNGLRCLRSVLCSRSSLRFSGLKLCLFLLFGFSWRPLWLWLHLSFSGESDRSAVGAVLTTKLAGSASGSASTPLAARGLRVRLRAGFGFSSVAVGALFKSAPASLSTGALSPSSSVGSLVFADVSSSEDAPWGVSSAGVEASPLSSTCREVAASEALSASPFGDLRRRRRRRRFFGLASLSLSVRVKISLRLLLGNVFLHLLHMHNLCRDHRH